MPSEYGPYFKLYHVKDDPEDASQIEGLLRPKHAPIPSDQLCRLLLSNCRTVIVEREYIDPDYRACYSRLYYLRHNDLARRCTRIHFFNDLVSTDDLANLSDEKQRSYRGFIVVRPLPSHWLGRSVLSYKLLEEVVRQNTDSVNYYLTCGAQYTVNLAGNEILFTAASWMQQDTMVSACASAAIWVVSSHMSHYFGPEFRSYLTPAITDLATKTNVDGGRAMPSAGLTTQQIMYALREMGYEPIIYSAANVRTLAEARQHLYFYIESGIPVILGLDFERGGHAVTTVGHSLDLGIEPRTQKVGIISYYNSSDFVPAFVVQDDANGPFRVLRLTEWNAWTSLWARDQRRRYICPVQIDTGETALLKALIIPVPTDVTLTGSAADQRARKGIAQWLISEGITKEPIVFRTFLERSNRFKARLVNNGGPNELTRHMRSHLMPRWVWVTEISRISEYLKPERLAMGHWIHDAASLSEAFQSTEVVAWHMPGMFFALAPDEKVTVEHPRYDDFPRYDRSAYEHSGPRY